MAPLSYVSQLPDDLGCVVASGRRERRADARLSMTAAKWLQAWSSAGSCCQGALAPALQGTLATTGQLRELQVRNFLRSYRPVVGSLLARHGGAPAF